MNEELRTIHLKGVLGRRFGKVHRLAVSSPAEAVRALCVLCKGFKQFLLTSSDQSLEYKVLVDREPQTEETLRMQRGAAKSFSFVPVIVGGKKQGAGQTILGAVLVVVGVLINVFSAGTGSGAGGPLISMGVSMMLGGVVQMLSAVPNAPKPDERDANRPGAYFNGPVNTTMQGQPVPICYGELTVGSATIGAGMRAERVAV